MSQETDYLLRLMSLGTKEAIVTAVTANLTPTEFTSQLTLGYKRKSLSVYNNSDLSSGECHYSYIASATNGSLSHPIPKGAKIEIPVSTDISVYFFASTETTTSGELGDLRVEEVS